ncbi:hypothetical protein ABW19_dt0209120 [Dactylella cylindrospora]|nr:hypothetical protein ABW19_dt0209120 [Dactylella cylindrospora]
MQYHTSHFFVVLFVFIALYFKTSNAETTINAYTDANCVFRPRAPQGGPPTGDCQQIATPNTISVSIETIDPGCTGIDSKHDKSQHDQQYIVGPINYSISHLDHEVRISNVIFERNRLIHAKFYPFYGPDLSGFE